VSSPCCGRTGSYNTGRPPLTIDGFGGHLIGHLDGVLLFNVRDTSLTGGKGGFYCWANARAASKRWKWNRSTPTRCSGSPVHEPGPGGDRRRGRRFRRPSQWQADAGTLKQTSEIIAPEAGVYFPATYARAGEPRWRDVHLRAAAFRR
jgi:hypothetical protein